MDRMTLPGLEKHPALQKYLDRTCKYLNDGDQDAAGNNLRKAIETMLQQYANDIPQVYDKNLSTMIASLRGLDVLSEEQIDKLDAMRLRGNASSHADEPGKPKREVSVGILKDDYETLFDEFLPAFVERFPEPVEKKPRVHPEYHANVDYRELGHPDIWYAASRFSDFDERRWYPDSYAELEQFMDAWNLHLPDAVRFYEEEIYLFWIGQSSIIENGELRIPTELQGFFGASGFTKRSYVDKYHNTQYELIPLGFSLFDSVRYLRSYCAETLYLPFDFSALPNADWVLSQQPESLVPEFCMDFSRGKFVKGIKCILIPHPSAGMKALSFDAWKRQFPELELLLLDEECAAFRAYIKEHENQPVGRRPVPQSLQVYWPAWAMDYPVFKSTGFSQDEIQHLLSCFALPVRDVSKTVEAFRARHPELPTLITTGDSGELKPPVPDWIEEEQRLTGFDRRQFMDMLRYMGGRVSVRPAAPQDVSGDLMRFYERRIPTPARCSVNQEGQTVTEYPSWALAAMPDDPARALAASAAMPVHSLDYEFREYLKTLPLAPCFDDSGMLRSIRAEGLGAPWLISDEEFEEAFAAMHAEEMAALAAKYAEQDGAESPRFTLEEGPFRLIIDSDNENRFLPLKGQVRCIRYQKDAGVCYDIQEKQSLWPQVPQASLAREATMRDDDLYETALFPPAFWHGSVLYYSWWWKKLLDEEGNCFVERREQVMTRAQAGARTKAFEAYLAALPFNPLCPAGKPLQSIVVSPDNEWGLTPLEFEWEFARRHAEDMEAASIELAKKSAPVNGLPFTLPAFHAGDRVKKTSDGTYGRVTVVRYLPGSGYQYDLMQENNGAVLYMVDPNVREDLLELVERGLGNGTPSASPAQGASRNEQQPEQKKKRGLLWRLTH